MNEFTRSSALCLLMLGVICTAAGDATTAEKAPEADKSTQQKLTAEQSSCINYCNAAEATCSSEVRRARAECSKRAANQGRDPFTMRNNDYTYFCGYFGNANACGAGTYTAACRNRFRSTYGLCVDAIQNNIASMRYDCYQTERTAQNYCRGELRECRATCK